MFGEGLKNSTSEKLGRSVIKNCFVCKVVNASSWFTNVSTHPACCENGSDCYMLVWDRDTARLHILTKLRRS